MPANGRWDLIYINYIKYINLL